MVKPCCSIVSVKSIVAPPRYGRAHAVDDDRDAVQVELDVTVEAALVEEELVLQAGAAAGLDGDAQPQVVAALLVEQRAHLDGGAFGQCQGRRDLLGGARQLDGCGLSGGHQTPSSTRVQLPDSMGDNEPVRDSYSMVTVVRHDGGRIGSAARRHVFSAV